MKQSFFLLLLLSTLTGYTQQDSIKKHVIAIGVNIKAETLNGYYLQSLTDSSISLSKQSVVYGSNSTKADRTINYKDIRTISYRRKGATGRTMLAGAAVGFFTGAIIGLASGDDPPGTWFRMTSGEKAATLGFLLGVTGTVVGAIGGLLSNKHFTVIGEVDRFQNFKQFVVRKSHRALAANY